MEAIPIEQLRGVGPQSLAKLSRLNIRSAQDLLFHLPSRYQDRTRVVPIARLHAGDYAVIQGEILSVRLKTGSRRLSLLVQLGDGTGSVTLRFFHFSAAQQNQLMKGTCLHCFGEVRWVAGGLEMVHPEYHSVEAGKNDVLEETLTPIYPTTDGVHQKTLRGLTEQALTLLKENQQVLPDWLPSSLLEQVFHGDQFPSLAEAVAILHRPAPSVCVADLLAGKHPAQQRLVIEELLAHHLSLRQIRRELHQFASLPLLCPGQLSQRFMDQLPFQLTLAQQRVNEEVLADVQKPYPMMRLVQGDVGCGKTIVAAVAALHAIECRGQAAVMAPTELLAEQHYKNFSEWFAPLGIEVAWLSGKLKGKAREKVIEAIKLGEAQAVVGTHALFQKDVVFAKLGLIVVDEQHRFGVHQRQALREKGRYGDIFPHQLIMTATPIPRTLAMTAYADLDVSVIDELPKGRQLIDTAVVPEHRREEVIERVKLACVNKRQVYWVCPLIDESETLNCEAAEKTFAYLTEKIPGIQIGLVHGRLKAEEKEQVMFQFKAGTIDLLVATTVIEVGVDVPNASLMIIENAERLGLAQLHQLRGRVGRGPLKSSCVLLYRGPLSEHGRYRLSIMRETNDGFKIAEKDLELRGPGELLGTRQTGVLQFRVADLARDGELIPKIEQVGDFLVDNYPEYVAPLIERWLGGGVQYSDV